MGPRKKLVIILAKARAHTIRGALPGVSRYERKYAARIIDVAPTLAKLLGVDVPKDAEGGVIYDILDRIEK